jgi:hypothetical protein
MGIDAVQYSDKIKHKWYDISYHTIQEMDNRVLYTDDTRKLYYLGHHLMRLRMCIMYAYEACALLDYEYNSLMTYIDEVRELILRKGGVCDTH